MPNNYSFKNFTDNMAKAIGKDLPISTKHSVELCNFIRGKKISEAKRLLIAIKNKKTAVPFKRYNSDMPHRVGMAAGRYPVKAMTFVLNILESAEANAAEKGLGAENLRIKHICAHQASRPWRYGRQGRRKARRTHIEVVVEEVSPNKAPSEEKELKLLKGGLLKHKTSKDIFNEAKK